MNRLETNLNGGFPLVLDDWRFIEAGILQAFRGIIATFMEPTLGSWDNLQNRALFLGGYGYDFDGEVHTIYAGFVAIGGEICYNPSPITFDDVPGYFPYFDIDVIDDPAGTKSFKDTITRETYKIRRVKVMFSNVLPLGYTKCEDTKTIYEVIQEKIALKKLSDVTYSEIDKHLLTFDLATGKFVSTSESTFKTRLKGISFGWVTILAASEIVPGCVVDYAIRKYTDVDNFVHLRGLISAVPGIEDQVLFNLGVEFPDQKNFVIPFVHSGGLQYGQTKIRIEVNGDVILLNQNHDSEVQFNMESIPPIRAV